MPRIARCLAMVLLAASCSFGAPSTDGDRVELTVFGAASLKGVLDTAKPVYEAVVPGTTLTLSTDASASLATQIEHGAPADVFLSADVTAPERLVNAGFVSGGLMIFATSKLTIIVPPDNPGDVRTPADLARPGLQIIAAGDGVPITRYAQRLIENLSAQPGYPAGFVRAYGDNVVSREDNVKAIVAKIELGEGDAGIVYVTDAEASSRVTAVALPETANVPATYAGVVIKTSPDQEAAKAFLGWFTGPGGQSILSSFGFLPPSPDTPPGY